MIKLTIFVAALALVACDAPSGAGSPAPVAETAPSKTPQEAGPLPEKETPMSDLPSSPASLEIATFGAGCYWCVEAVLEQLDGVKDVVSGFMGGHVENPSYEAVCTGKTGHVEVVQVHFDPAKVDYQTLLEWFFKLHDPTQVNGQGNDIGPQYRSAIFTHSEAQQKVAVAVKEALEQKKAFPRPIATEITSASVFYKAKEDHQDYYRANRSAGYCRMVILPKLEKLGLEY